MAILGKDDAQRHGDIVRKHDLYHLFTSTIFVTNRLLIYAANLDYFGDGSARGGKRKNESVHDVVNRLQV